MSTGRTTLKQLMCKLVFCLSSGIFLPTQMLTEDTNFSSVRLLIQTNLLNLTCLILLIKVTLYLRSNNNTTVILPGLLQKPNSYCVKLYFMKYMLKQIFFLFSSSRVNSKSSHIKLHVNTSYWLFSYMNENFYVNLHFQMRLAIFTCEKK